MATLGTRKFYKSWIESSKESDNQILKNSGYISIVLHSICYNSASNFWQNIFGGTDNIALISTITYQSGNKKIEAKSVQDKRIVKTDSPNYLGISRLVALKIPATADGLELKVELTAIKEDNFDEGLKLMNSDEFKVPLQLSSQAVGEILSITKMVKKIFTSNQNNSVLEATFAGIISISKMPKPIKRERLTSGYLIMIANNDEENDLLALIDEKDLEVVNDGIKYKKKHINLTNVIYQITFEELRGVEQNSNWFSKYKLALNKLDDLVFAETEAAQTNLLNESKKLWIEGNALLFCDPTYIHREQNDIKNYYFKAITDKYKKSTSKPIIELIDVVIDTNKEEFGYLHVDKLKRGNVQILQNKINKLAKSYIDGLGALKIDLPV